jgi:hypothetical protein
LAYDLTFFNKLKYARHSCRALRGINAFRPRNGQVIPRPSVAGERSIPAPLLRRSLAAMAAFLRNDARVYAAAKPLSGPANRRMDALAAKRKTNLSGERSIPNPRFFPRGAAKKVPTQPPVKGSASLFPFFIRNGGLIPRPSGRLELASSTKKWR